MRKFALFISIFIFAFTVNDVQKEFILLNWDFVADNGKPQNSADGFSSDNMVFVHSGKGVPVFSKIYPLQGMTSDFTVAIENPHFEEWKLNDKHFLNEDILREEIQVESMRLKSGNDYKFRFRIIPLIKKGDKIFRLKSFNLKRIPVTVQTKSAVAETRNWKPESILKNGKWIKISTSAKGIYKIPYSKLRDWGFSNPSQVNVFGSGGKILSENPADIEYDDLPQIAVSHGKNNGSDCLFFYVPGVTEWKPDRGNDYFVHRLNDYSTKGFFFLSEEVGAAKTVERLPEVQEEATHRINSFDAYELYEIEEYNLLPDGSGKQWFGDKFLNNSITDVNFELTGLDDPESVQVIINAAARSSSGSEMAVNVNQINAGKLEFYRVETDEAYGTYADERKVVLNPSVQGEQLNLALKYFATGSNSEAWLDFIEVNYRRKLRLNGDVLFFRDLNTARGGNVLEFTIENAGSSAVVFDVTDMYNVKEVPLQVSGSAVKGKRPAGNLREYAAFDVNGSFPEPELVGEVENQNLHGLSTPEFLIITHPNFLSSANALADFHRSYDGMDVEVVEAPKVYNEFSSGAKNATGIRNFIKMFYDRQEKLQYILLFGDGSYDNKNVKPESNSFIPTYQSRNSLVATESFVTDDYFVLLDDNESVYNGAVDLGIGRIPASTPFEAELVLNKIRNYYSPQALGNWRNIISFIGDDEDGNLHMSQSENLANIVNNKYKEFITDKIYFDAYQQEASPERYPDVTDAINKRVKDGVLILNYVGHANARYLADERVLDISNINSWSNSHTLPIFVTATCEFSRFDANEMSAGEYVLFNPSGGGIGLFSTTRLVYAWSNFQLSKAFYNRVFERDENGNHYRMGDIMRLAKTNTQNDIGINKRNFSLLADPALRLSFPEYQIVTTGINSREASVTADTVGALQQVTVTGYVADLTGNKMDGFTGEMVPTVYDKEITMKTLGNGGASPMNFEVRENIIYKGLTSVDNGEFSFSFVIPKDISYKLGQGKIVYYADNGEKDAHGAFENFYIGGASSSDITDIDGPEIDLYMDSPDFRSGDRTAKNPTMLAFLSDENGINTVGTGIGHDITAVLDDDYSNVYVLNNFYQANVDDYTGGTIRFPFKNLAPGKHTLKLKVWDVANNSSEAVIEFLVTGEFEITEISNYPNPVSDYTFFTFGHNQSDESVNAIFEIFDQSGRIIDSFTMQVGSNGTKSNPVRWDLSAVSGRLQNGMYFYKITAQNSNGMIASSSGKMLIVR